MDGRGDLFVADAAQNVVYEVSPAGSITTVASDLDDPTGLAVDAQGDLFIADAGNDVVREVTPGPDGLLSDGTITTVAGNGTGGYSGDNGQADPRSSTWTTTTGPCRAWRSTPKATCSSPTRATTPFARCWPPTASARSALPAPLSPTSQGATGPDPDVSKDDLQGIAVDAQGDLFMA